MFQDPRGCVDRIRGAIHIVVQQRLLLRKFTFGELLGCLPLLICSFARRGCCVSGIESVLSGFALFFFRQQRSFALGEVCFCRLQRPKSIAARRDVP